METLEVDKYFMNPKERLREIENIRTTLQMLRTDKYAGPQSMKHIDKTVGELMADCLELLAK